MVRMNLARQSDLFQEAKNFQKANFATKYFSRIEQRIATVSI